MWYKTWYFIRTINKWWRFPVSFTFIFYCKRQVYSEQLTWVCDRTNQTNQCVGVLKGPFWNGSLALMPYGELIGDWTKVEVITWTIQNTGQSQVSCVLTLSNMDLKLARTGNQRLRSEQPTEGNHKFFDPNPTRAMGTLISLYCHLVSLITPCFSLFPEGHLSPPKFEVCCLFASKNMLHNAVTLKSSIVLIVPVDNEKVD